MVFKYFAGGIAVDDVGLFTLIFTGTWCLLGVIFLCVGIGLRRSAARRDERLRARAQGTVTEVVRRVGGSYGKSGPAWYPIVDFNADGRTVSLECAEGGGRKSFYEGQSVEVLYDPDDPSCFRLDGRDTLALVGRVFFWIGLACVAVGAGVGLLVNRLAASGTAARLIGS